MSELTMETVVLDAQSQEWIAESDAKSTLPATILIPWVLILF